MVPQRPVKNVVWSGMMKLEGKTALVTGASRGIGAATALLLARHGAAIAVNYYKNKEAATALVDEIVANKGKAVAIQTDMMSREDVENLVRQTREELGEIDILVVNAAITFRVEPFLEYSWEDFEQKYVGEMKAAFFVTKVVAQQMTARRTGSIIMVSSGLSRHPGPGFCAHSTAKSALNAFVRAVALELGPSGVRVNTVSPGLTITDATAFLSEEQKQMAAAHAPLQRNAMPEDIAGAILFFASAESQFVTGSYLPVDGGMTML
jgi:3-oxoacyl-[acyl-carrier protein] reductase